MAWNLLYSTTCYRGRLPKYGGTNLPQLPGMCTGDIQDPGGSAHQERDVLLHPLRLQSAARQRAGRDCGRVPRTACQRLQLHGERPSPVGAHCVEGVGYQYKSHATHRDCHATLQCTLLAQAVQAYEISCSIGYKCCVCNEIGRF